MSDPVTTAMLGQSITVLSGFAFPSTGFNQLVGLPLIRIRDLGRGETQVRFRGQHDPAYLVTKGDVLIGMDGDFEVHRWTGDVALLNQRVCRVEAATGEVEQRFLYWYLKPKVAEIHRRTPQTTVRHLSASDLYTIPMPSMDAREQLVVAQVLDTLDTAIHETEAIIAKLKSVKQGLLHDLLTRGIDANGELRPTHSEAPRLYKESQLGFIPKEWEPVQLNDVVDHRRPIVYGILMPGYGWPGGVPVVKVRDIVNDEIDLENLLLTSPKIDREYSRSRLQTGDLLFTIRGTVGRTAFVPSALDQANITQDTARVSIQGIDAGFVRAFLNSQPSQRFIGIHTLGVAVQGINLRDVRRIPIAKPSPPEAREISGRISAASARVESELLDLEKLKLAKSGLVDDLLTGRVRVTALLSVQGGGNA